MFLLFYELFSSNFVLNNSHCVVMKIQLILWANFAKYTLILIAPKTACEIHLLTVRFLLQI